MTREVKSESQSFLQKDPSRTWLWVFGGIIILIILVGLGSVFLPEQFMVKNVVVSNTRPEVAQQIKNYVQEVVQNKSKLFGKTSIFLVPRDFLEYELPNKFAIIKTVQILRELPSTVHIVIQEKVPVAVLISGGVSYALDPGGVAFEEFSQERMQTNKYPIISDERKTTEIDVGKSVMDPRILTMMHDIARLFPERFGIQIDKITIPAIGSQELHVYTSEGWMLVLDNSRTLDEQFLVLEKILTEQITNDKRPMLSYIDLRAAGKAFFKFKDGT
ncbi:MAG: hypothetical protein Q7S57_03115 [bacterium]|nr:hypothetical protein [bacterium]